jgi:hypothetical protein
MRTIYKYPFNVSDVVELELPRGARVLHIDVQGGLPCLWALVDTDNPPERAAFRLFGTGQPLPDDVTHTGHVTTFFHGPFVWHVFRSPGDQPALEGR